MSFFNFSRPKKNKQLQPTLFENQSRENNNSEDETESLDEGASTGTKLKIVAALFIVGFAGYVAFWVQSPSEIQTDILNNNQTQTQLLTQTGETQQVSMIDFSFDPTTLHIQKGTTVVWTNKDTVPHNVTADSFSSDTLNPGQSFSYTFQQDGIYDYHCSFHPQMKGSIMVGDNFTQTQSVQNTQTQDAANLLHGVADSEGTQNSLPPLNALNPDDTGVTTQLQSSSVDPTLFQDSSQQSQTQVISSTDTGAPETLTSDSQHGAAVEPLSVSAKKIVRATKFSKLSSSGPEDYLYFGIFGIILFLNRKKLLKLKTNE